MGRKITPLGALGRGMLAGAAGTAAMDALMYRRYRRDGGSQPLLSWETSAGLDEWEGAPAPAQVGKRLIEGLFQTEVDPKWARLTSNVIHWGTGLAWGAQYGLAAGSASAGVRRRWGPVLGASVFANSYVVLPLAGLYKPIWEYDAPTLAKDLSAHLVYGVVTAEAFRLVDRRGCVSRG